MVGLGTIKLAKILFPGHMLGSVSNCSYGMVVFTVVVFDQVVYSSQVILNLPLGLR